MTKRTVVLSSATGMLLMIFSSVIDAQLLEHDPVVNVDPITLSSDTRSTNIKPETSVYEVLLDVSGFAEQLAKLPDAVSNSIESALIDNGSMDSFDPTDIPYLKQAVPAAFSAETLYQAVFESLHEELSIEDAKQLIKFYSSPAGSALRRAETTNSILNNADRFKYWYATQGIASLSDERLATLRELEQAMQATQGAVDAMIGMQVAMQVSLTAVLPADQQRSARDLLSAAQMQRPALTKHYRQSSLETLGFVFQQQSLDELRKYSTVLNTEAGQHYVVAINGGLSLGLIRAAENLGLSIQTLVAGQLGQGV